MMQHIYDVLYNVLYDVACRLIKHKNRLLFIQNSMEIHMKEHRKVYKYKESDPDYRGEDFNSDIKSKYVNKVKFFKPIVIYSISSS